MPRALRSAFVACLCALVLAACDDTPGAPDPFGDPPSITAFSVLPETVEALGTDPAVTIEPTLAVTVMGGSGAVTLRALVRGVDGDGLVAEVEETATSDGRVELRPAFTVPRGAVGAYEITVTAEDASGRIGDRASGVLTFTSPSLGAPEVTETLAEPATIARPASGAVVVTLLADTADPDGEANVAYVELREEGGGVFARMSDDGTGASGSGDAQAGDGRYTVRLRVSAAIPTGEYRYNVVAVDRTGLESVPTPPSFTVN